MFKDKLTTNNAMLLLWIPLITLFFSIYFIFQDQYTFVFGILILGMAIDGLVDLKVKGLDSEDERYFLIKEKSNQFAHIMTLSVIFVLVYIHFFHVTLEGFVLVLLLIVSYASSSLSSLYLSFKY